jgi:hypothetical protein
MRLWRALLLAFAAVILPLACADKKRAPLAATGPVDSGISGTDAGLMLDVDQPPTGPCGSESIPAISNPPNISFIIDHSDSMRETLAGSGLSKYENARIALRDVLRAVGHRVNYGVTIFPGLDGSTGCEAGDELMKVAPGDPPSYARAGKNGPRLKDLLSRLQIADTDGGTPTAATLTKSLESLSKLEGATYVVLVTDGAPNCNLDLMCNAGACIPNIEQQAVECTSSFNCCAPDESRPKANLSCVDADASVAAVQALSDAGIKTFVVGMPGSEPYVALLNQMAEAGGTARAGDTKFYPVNDTEALEQSLVEIAASVAISCDIALNYDPPDRDFVNVYFDGVVVEYDPEGGWEWTEDGHVAIRGAACDQLTTGDVLEVQVFAGCKTVVK